ncbi:hypothetical protein KHA80_03360 [Anaerobacillus sp. HL2]|nr:hypothetical protein KHA80_03360 [Anaerobacillus sp. HL2]
MFSKIVKNYGFYEINSFADVENSFFHLREPIISDTVQINKHEIELLIVPGLVFDKQGYRIGFGGGYFDRLTDYNQLTLSLLFTFR